ncbi:MAG: hypothetical protein RL290_996 [Actinomycetota bacterium]
MPSFVSAKTSCTACAITWAVEWRRTKRPSGELIETDSTASPSCRSVQRSLRTPLIRQTTTSLLSAKRWVGRWALICLYGACSTINAYLNHVASLPNTYVPTPLFLPRRRVKDATALNQSMKWHALNANY